MSILFFACLALKIFFPIPQVIFSTNTSDWVCILFLHKSSNIFLDSSFLGEKIKHPYALFVSFCVVMCAIMRSISQILSIFCSVAAGGGVAVMLGNCLLLLEKNTTLFWKMSINSFRSVNFCDSP